MYDILCDDECSRKVIPIGNLPSSSDVTLNHRIIFTLEVKIKTPLKLS